MPNSIIIVYATDWCGDCLRTRRMLEKRNVPFNWINIDRDLQAERFVLNHNQGLRSVPMIIFPDGSIMVEPKFSELVNKILSIKTDL